MFNFKLKQKRRYIVHVDADAFFASVEQSLNPSLKGKPLLVGSDEGSKGIVSAASYEAKAFGVYSGMPMYLAKERCPKATIVRANFNAYHQFSSHMYKIFCDLTPETEMVSIDEAFLDLTGSVTEKKSAPELVKEMMFRIFKELNITVSCGISSNKTVSKLASSQNKPHKLTVVPFGKEREFLSPFELKDLSGVGRKSAPILERAGFKKISQIAELSMDQVMKIFGVRGIPLWKRCRGIDNSEVISSIALPKSISKENTFQNIAGEKEALKALKMLSGTVFEKLRRHKMKAKTIFLRVRYKTINYELDGHRFEDYTFQANLPILASSDLELWPVLKELFLNNYDRQRKIRLLGVGVSNILQNYNLSLFGSSRKYDLLFESMDKIRTLYGEDAIKYGA